MISRPLADHEGALVGSGPLAPASADDHALVGSDDHAPADAGPRPVEVLLGRYRVIGRIAAGSLGTVLAAVDERSGRDVALKLFDGADDNRAAWVHELRLAARLRHDNIAACLDVGEDPSGAPILVFARARGGSLRRAIAAGHRFDPAAIVALLRDVGRALTHAHAQRVIHRDVKPENILAAERPGAGPWLLTDFGAGRFLARGHLARSLAGSRRYMAPEVLLRAATPASDLFSLGMVALELLRGEAPHEAHRARFALAERGAPGLTGLIASLVDPDPRRRPFDALALLRALDRPRLAAPLLHEDRAGRRHALEGDLLWRTEDDEGGAVVGRIANALAFASVDGATTPLVAAPRRLVAVDRATLATVLAADRPFDTVAADLDARVAWLRDGEHLHLADLPLGAVRRRARAPELLLNALAAPRRRAAVIGAATLALGAHGDKDMFLCTWLEDRLKVRRLALPGPLDRLTGDRDRLLATCGDGDRAHLVAITAAGPARVLADRDASVDAVRVVVGEGRPALIDLAPTLASALGFPQEVLP